MWTRRELENYVASEEVLIRWARNLPKGDLFSLVLSDTAEANMREAISEVQSALIVLGKEPWSEDVKATDEVLDVVFRRFFSKQGTPTQFWKGQYYQLVEAMEAGEVHADIRESLDEICQVAARARPTE